MGRRRDSGDYTDGLPDDGTPVDIAAVRRDDALIDAISGDGPVETRSPEEYELATLLAGWRAEILAEPLPAGPDLDEVVAAVNRELGAREALASRHTRSKSQLRLLRPIAGAAALIAVAIGGAAAVSYSAEPGDPLWGVKSVVFSEQAESTVARIDTASTLEQAEKMISEGNTAGAQELLESAEARSSDITDSGQRNELGDWLQRLAGELNQLVLPTLPPAPVPPPVAPAVPPPPAEVPQAPGTPPATGVPPVSSTTLPASPPPPPPSPVPSPAPVDPVEPVDPTILETPPPSGGSPSTVPAPPPNTNTGTPAPTQPADSTTVPEPPTTTVSSSSASDIASPTSQGYSVTQNMQTVEPSP